MGYTKQTVKRSKRIKKKKKGAERDYRSEGFDHVDPKSWSMQTGKQRKRKKKRRFCNLVLLKLRFVI